MEDALLNNDRSEAENAGVTYPRISCIFWISLFTSLSAIVTLATVHGTHDFYYIRSNWTSPNHTTHHDFTNSTCKDRLVSLWSDCVRTCGDSTYDCSGLSPDGDEGFITASRVLESLALFFAVFGLALSITSHINKRIGELKTSILCFLAAGTLCIIGAYLFVLKFRGHIPDVDEEPKKDEPEVVSQGPRSSFYLCVVSFVMSMFTALLYGTEWCRAISYGFE